MDESSFIGPGTDLGLNDAQSDAFAEIISERSGGNHIGIIRALRKKIIDPSAIRSRTYQLAGNRRGRGLASRRPRKLGEVTIVIPVLNESRRISSVVKFGLSSHLVKEVLVIDDGSIDGTPELAE